LLWKGTTLAKAMPLQSPSLLIGEQVYPGRPEVSAMLAADLDAHFSLPARTPADLVFPSYGLE
jgi:hypothetical protein